MPKYKSFALVLLSSGVVVFFAFLFWPREREPAYNGKQLSEWLLEFKANTYVANWDYSGSESADAMQHIGTNALPWLLKWIPYQRPAWRIKLTPAFNRLPPRIKRWAIIRSIPDDAHTRRAQAAVYALGILGPDAIPAVPDLCRLIKPGSPFPGQKSFIFERMGTNTLPALLCVLTNRSNSNRAGAVEGLRSARLQERAISEIQACIGDKDPLLAETAINALRDLGNRFGGSPADTNALRSLASALNDPRPRIRTSAVKAVGDFGKTAAPFAPAMVKALSDRHWEVREAATNALAKIEGPHPDPQ